VILTQATTTPALLPVLYNGGSPYAPPQRQAGNENEKPAPHATAPVLEIYAPSGKTTNAISRSISPHRGAVLDVYL
jgi:hypothetical protein